MCQIRLDSMTFEQVRIDLIQIHHTEPYDLENKFYQARSDRPQQMRFQQIRSDDVRLTEIRLNQTRRDNVKLDRVSLDQIETHVIRLD